MALNGVSKIGELEADHTNERYDPDGDGTVDTADHAQTADSAQTADFATNAGDADTVDGNDAADLGSSTSQVQEDSMIWSEGFAPGFGG